MWGGLEFGVWGFELGACRPEQRDFGHCKGDCEKSFGAREFTGAVGVCKANVRSHKTLLEGQGT